MHCIIHEDLMHLCGLIEVCLTYYKCNVALG